MTRATRAAALAALSLAACSQMPSTSPTAAPPGSRQLEYRCPGGKRFDVLMWPSGDKLKLELEGVLYELKQVRSASGARFSDGTTTYWSKGREATIERNGKVVYRDCRTND